MFAPPNPDRRRLLQLAAASAATLWLPRSAWSQAKIATNPFTLGVASGSPSDSTVVLWTRLMGDLPPAPVTVQWEIADDEAFAHIVQRGQAQALPELAHSVHVDARGLAPDRWYFYRFMVGDATSPTGRTRTFPAPDAMAQRLRLAYASCQRWDHGYFSAWRHMLGENLDVVLFLGDYIYEYANSKDAVRVPPGGWVLTLDDYRARYALHRGEPELQAMHAACPWLLAWDDHEVQNDYAGTREGHSGPEVPDFVARRAAAYQAYYEHMPVRASALTRAVAGLTQGAETRMYMQLRYGRLANFLMLDDRQYRDPQVCNEGDRPGSSTIDPAKCPPWEDPKRTLLGDTQERWLDAQLARRGPGWTVFGQQTLFGQRDFRAGPERSFWNDGWDGYPQARKRLTEALVRHEVKDTVMFGGDVHENWVGHIKADYANPASASLGAEFCGTSITSRSGGNARIAPVLPENPHFVFADAERKGYGVAEFTPGRVTTQLRVVDDVRRRDTAISTLASFAMESGSTKVERA